MQSESIELEPWVIVSGKVPETSVVLWRLATQDADSLAIFSDQTLAERYAHEHCHPPWECRQLDQSALLRVAVDCFREGIEYATLNPSQTGARQVFVLREVLKAAKTQLSRHRGES